MPNDSMPALIRINAANTFKGNMKNKTLISKIKANNFIFDPLYLILNDIVFDPRD